MRYGLTFHLSVVFAGTSQRGLYLLGSNMNDSSGTLSALGGCSHCPLSVSLGVFWMVLDKKLEGKMSVSRCRFLTCVPGSPTSEPAWCLQLRMLFSCPHMYPTIPNLTTPLLLSSTARARYPSFLRSLSSSQGCHTVE